jgi:hypothetical protein
MNNRAPDMRLFQAIEKDHTTYDQCLTKLYESKVSLWTRSTLPGSSPVTTDHFRMDAQRKISNLLADVPALKGQDLSDKRKMMLHIAHELVTRSGMFLHLRQPPNAADIMTKEIRANIRMILTDKVLLIQSDEHPLENDFKKKLFTARNDSGPITLSSVPATSQDAVIAKYLIGPHPNLESDITHLRSIFEQATPYLMSAQPDAIESPLLELRQKLMTMLREQDFFDHDLRIKTAHAIADDWQQTYTESGEAEVLDNIEKEVENETGVKKIIDAKPDIILATVFDALIKKDPEDPDVRAALMRRRPLLDMIVYEAMREENKEVMAKMGDIYRVYSKRLKIEHKDLGHFGLLIAAISETIDIDTYRMFLG